MFFSKEVRAKMKEENPQAAVTAKLLGEMWAKMDEKEKEKYEQMAKEDRERYNEEMKAFKKGDSVVPSTSQVAMEAEEWLAYWHRKLFILAEFLFLVLFWKINEN